MDLKIKNKNALVLGASTGLGFAIAQALINEGVNVAIGSSNPKKLEDAKIALGTEHAFVVDLNLPKAGQEVVKQAIKAMGSVDILVTNTGGPPAGPFATATPEKWTQGFQSLWLSTVEAIHECLPIMKEKHWGRILMVTSAAAKEPIHGLTISNGLRAGLLGLAKTLSNEVAGDGITVNCLLPGYTKTQRLKELNVGEAILSQIPAGRLGEPEEFAALATFLASTQAGYISGQAIACDGGYLKGH